MFDTLDDFSATLHALPSANRLMATAARRRQTELTKPPGSLGRLEDCAIALASWQNTERPVIAHPTTLIFAGNHGVTAHGVSPYRSEVTAQMVANFAAGGAAINALTDVVGAQLHVVPIELARPTGDISAEPALATEELLDALNVGANAIPNTADLLALGEMGIGNTTIAAALAAACFGGSGSDWSGPGTGLDRDGVDRKAEIVDAALDRHRAAVTAVDKLRRLGGREVAALAGAAVAARLKRIPVILDGYVACAAIAPLFVENPAIVEHCFAGHLSAEPAHRRLLVNLGLDPLLDLGMRLGEASGATLAITLLKAAVAAHNGMATFDEAAVSNKAPS